MGRSGVGPELMTGRIAAASSGSGDRTSHANGLGPTRFVPFRLDRPRKSIPGRPSVRAGTTKRSPEPPIRREPMVASGRPDAMPDARFRSPSERRVLALAATLLLAACAGAATSSPPAGTGAPGAGKPSDAPTQAPTVGMIEHPTGATDVVLRLEEGGGFVPMEMTAAQAPTFTLYGNGVIVFQPRVETFPQPDANGIIHAAAWHTAKLDESQIQDLLEFAIGPGGLGTARDSYVDNGIADAPNTIFTLHAGGIEKTVVINALADGGSAGPDAAARAAFLKLADRLRDFDEGGSIPTDIYQPDDYRAVLLDREGPVAGAIDWPWSSLTPGDFVADPSGSNGTTFPHRALPAADVDALGVKDAAGGLQGIVLSAPGGKHDGLIVRPLLPDETS